MNESCRLVVGGGSVCLLCSLVCEQSLGDCLDFWTSSHNSMFSFLMKDLTASLLRTVWERRPLLPLAEAEDEAVAAPPPMPMELRYE